MKKHLLFLLRIAVTLVIVFILWLALRDKTDELIFILKSSNLFWLALGFLLFVFNILLLSIRLKLVLSTQNLRLSLRKSVILNFIGFFFNGFLPTSVGGDIARGYYAAEMFDHKKVECYASVFVDRTIGFISIASIALFSLCVISEKLVTFKTKILIFGIFAAAVFFIFFSLNKKFASKFKFLLSIMRSLKFEEVAKRIYFVLNNFKNYKIKGILVFLVAFLGQGIVITSSFMISKSLGLELPYTVFLLFIPLVSGASLVPSLGGMGPREGAFILLFGSLVDKTQAAAIALLWLVYFLGLSILGGIIYIISGYHRLSISEIEKEREFNYDRQKTT